MKNIITFLKTLIAIISNGFNLNDPKGANSNIVAESLITIWI